MQVEKVYEIAFRMHWRAVKMPLRHSKELPRASLALAGKMPFLIPRYSALLIITVTISAAFRS